MRGPRARPAKLTTMMLDNQNLRMIAEAQEYECFVSKSLEPIDDFPIVNFHTPSGMISIPSEQAKPLLDILARAKENYMHEELDYRTITEVLKDNKITPPEGYEQDNLRWFDDWLIDPECFSRWHDDGGTEWEIIDDARGMAYPGEFYYYHPERWFITLDQGDTDASEDDQLFVTCVRAVLQYLEDRLEMARL